MIRHAKFRNFKSLRHVDVDFEPLTVFVGPNASGKTSILQGLHLLLRMLPEDSNERLYGDHSVSMLYTKNSTGEMSIEAENEETSIRFIAPASVKDKLIEVLKNSGTGQAELEVLHKALPAKGKITTPLVRLAIEKIENGSIVGDGTLKKIEEFLNSESQQNNGIQNWHGVAECRGLSNQNSDWDSGEDCVSAFDKNEATVFIRLNANALAEPSYGYRIWPRLEYNGGGLAEILANMALNDPDTFQIVQSGMRSIIPHLERVRFERVPVVKYETESVTIDMDKLTRQVKRQYMGDALLFDFKSAKGIPAQAVSEGTLLALGLLTVLLGPLQPKIVLLDDFDQGLHPRAQEECLNLLRKLMAQNSELQIIATSHSPYLLDCLRPEEVRLTTLKEDGSTACAPISAHPKFEKWRKEMSPGEMWSLFGEEWIQPVL